MRNDWKTACAPIGTAVSEMNRLETEGYRVTHVFPVLVPRRVGQDVTNVVDQKIFITASKETP